MYDVIVAGGGPAGASAAVSSARLGAKTLLIERYGFLGGMNTAGLVGPIMTFHAGKTQIVRGIPDEMIQKLKKLGGTPGYLVDPIWGTTSMCPVDTDLYKSVLMETVTSAGVELLLHSFITGASSESGSVRAIQVANKSGVSEVSAKVLIDCTGDGDLAARIGVPFRHGRETDGLTQPMTLMFKMGGVEIPAVRKAIRENPGNFYLGLPLEEYLDSPGLGVSGFFAEVEAGRKDGSFPIDRDRVLFFGLPREGEITVNTLRITHVSGVDPQDLTRAEKELRLLVPRLVAFMRDRLPGFSKSYLLETAPQVGVRETRHIQGDYTLTAQDVLSRRKFEDVIAHASYPIDIHSPSGKGMEITHEVGGESKRGYYDIPLRTMLPVGIRNLIVAGRCISADHAASGSARISATCATLGEAAGVLAALAVRKAGETSSSSSDFFGVDVRRVDCREVQRQLVRQGAFLEI